MGRNRTPIDWQIAIRMAAQGIEGRTIAAVFGLSPERFCRRCREDHKLSFSELCERGTVETDEDVETNPWGWLLDR